MRLSKEERVKIEQLRRQTRDKKQHVRLSVLIMLDKGFTPEVIAVSQGIDADTVGNYKREDIQQGLDEYLKDNYVAYRGELSQGQLQALDQQIEQGLYPTAREVGDYIFGAFGIDYSDSAVRTILAKLDFVHKPVEPLPAQADEQKQLEFEAQFEQLIEQLPQDTVVYFTDATHLSDVTLVSDTHNTQPAKAWVNKGQQKLISANSGRKRVNLNGAVNAQNIITLYEKLLENNPGKKLVLICDEDPMSSHRQVPAPYYCSRLLQEWLEGQPLIKQWFLPAYSPNLNIIERPVAVHEKQAIGLSSHPAY